MDRLVLKDDGIAEGQPFQCFVSAENFKRQNRSFQRVEDNAFHLIKVNWTAPTFEEDRCVRAFVRVQPRALNNSNVRVTCLQTRKLCLFPWDRRWESPNWIHQMRRSRLCFPKREIRP